MIASRTRQVLSPVLALVFVLGVLGGAYGLHGCPRHASMAGSGSASSTPPDPAADAASGTASPGGSPVVRGRGERGGDAGGSFCICVGSCHAGSAAAHPTPAPVALSIAVAGPEAPDRVARDVPPYESPAYFLPYPLGPPTA